MSIDDAILEWLRRRGNLYMGELVGGVAVLTGSANCEDLLGEVEATLVHLEEQGKIYQYHEHAKDGGNPFKRVGLRDHKMLRARSASM